MFNFRKVKNNIHNWAQDVEANDQRTLDVLLEILNPISSITKLWKNDPAYIESNKQIILFMNQLYAFGKINDFLKYYYSKEFLTKIKLFLDNGEDASYARHESIKYYVKLSKLNISNENEMNEFCRMIDKLDQLIIIKKLIQENIISQKSEGIYINYQFINLIRQKNGVYEYLIGKSENVNQCLGENGFKLKQGDKQAISYIVSLEDLEEKLEIKKTVIELEQEGRKR